MLIVAEKTVSNTLFTVPESYIFLDKRDSRLQGTVHKIKKLLMNIHMTT